LGHRSPKHGFPKQECDSLLEVCGNLRGGLNFFGPGLRSRNKDAACTGGRGRLDVAADVTDERRL
jgi:hypothetical protein